MAKITKQKARKQYECGRCGRIIEKGEEYRKTTPRYSPKKIRCSDSGCYFRFSELVTSDKLSRAYKLVERLQEMDNPNKDDAVGELNIVAEEAREIASEYQESTDNIMEYFPNGNSQSEECEEKCGYLEEWADNLENLASEIDEGDVPDEETGEKISDIAGELSL